MLMVWFTPTCSITLIQATSVKMFTKLKPYAALVLGIASCLINASPAPLVARSSLNSAQLFKRTPIPDTTDPLCTTLYVGQEATLAQVCLSFSGDNLVVTYGSGSGLLYTKVHLYLSRDSPPPSPPAPGLFNYNSYCTVAPDGSTAVCTVPFANLPGGLDQLCSGVPFYIATHADLGTETGWGFGTCVNGIDPKTPDTPPPKGCAKDWAMYWTFTILCKEPPPPPPSTHVCDIGTAFGYNAAKYKLLNTIPGAPKGRWGWYYKLTSAEFPLIGDLLVGAGGNDISKATDAGDFSIAFFNGIATVTYTAGSGFDINEVHVYASCSPPTTVAPGQYGYTATFSGTSDTSFSHDFTLGTCSYYYFILHATFNKEYPADVPCPTTAT
jgi:hypothetical protein